ncbi:MAG: hypothetical protein ACPGO5_00705 [Patescibacteria group bacterium]
MKEAPFTIKKVFSYSWTMYKHHIGFLVLLMLALFGVSMFFGWVQGLAEDSQMLLMLITGISWLVQIIIGMILIHVVLQLLDTHKASLQTATESFVSFWRYLGGVLLTSLIVTAGFFLLIIPGVYLAIRLQFVQYLIIDKNYSPLDAIQKSFELTRGVVFELFLLAIVFFVINVVGAALFGLGLFVSVPLTLLATAYVYRLLLGMSPELPVVAEASIGPAVQSQTPPGQLSDHSENQ